MNKYLLNIRDNRLTSIVGVVTILLLLLKIFHIDIETIIGLNFIDTALLLSMGISGIMNLFSKDPHK